MSKPRTVIETRGQWAPGWPITIACDGKCNKAWGIGTREAVQLSDDEDDYEYLADHELGEAPRDPGSYEGADGKPRFVWEVHNKWCTRACERATIVDGHDTPYGLDDFSKRVRNMGRLHEPE